MLCCAKIDMTVCSGVLRDRIWLELLFDKYRLADVGRFGAEPKAEISYVLCKNLSGNRLTSFAEQEQVRIAV